MNPPKIDIETQLHILNCFRILSILSNNILSPLTWPIIMTMITFFSSFGIYGCVKLHNAVPPHIFPMFPMALQIMVSIIIFLFPRLGGMNARSMETLEKFGNFQIKYENFQAAASAVSSGTGSRTGTEIMGKENGSKINHTQTKILKLRLRAMRPISARVGSVFHIKRTTILIIIVVISNVTINAILLH